MKQYWHTGTLFISWWKYKWANRYDHCIDCKTCNRKHKWNWLCTICFDNKRITPERTISKRKACMKWHQANYKYIPKEEQKRKWPKWFLTPEERKKYQHEWYLKNKYIKSFLIKKSEKSYNLPEYRWYYIKLDLASWTPSEIDEKMSLFNTLKNWIDKRK